MEIHNVPTCQRWSRFLLAGLLGLSTAGVLAARTPLVQAAPSVCPKTEGKLQSSITTAGDGGTVRLSCASRTTITFSTTIHITKNVTLDASGSRAGIILTGNKNLYDVTGSLGLNSITVSKAASPLYIHIGATAKIKNSTFSLGGAILNAGSLTVTNSAFTGNSGSDGGAINNDHGTVTVTNSTFTKNSVAQDGGAINSDEGTVTVSGSTFDSNGAWEGGAISDVGQSPLLTVSDSTFSNNSGQHDGGAILGGGTITASTFVKNSVEQDGGAIFGGGTITASTFTKNSAGHREARSSGMAHPHLQQ